MTTLAHDLDVQTFLTTLETETAYRIRQVQWLSDTGCYCLDPHGRCRLDHYVGRHRAAYVYENPDEDFDFDPEGWDEDAWDEDYACPLTNEVEAALKSRFPGRQFLVDVGEKGHVYVTETPSP